MTYKELYNLFINCINAKYTTVENEGDYCIAKNGSTLYLFFEWTDSATDWKNNFAFFTTPYKNMEESWYLLLCIRLMYQSVICVLSSAK